MNDCEWIKFVYRFQNFFFFHFSHFLSVIFVYFWLDKTSRKFKIFGNWTEDRRVIPFLIMEKWWINDRNEYSRFNNGLRHLIILFIVYIHEGPNESFNFRSQFFSFHFVTSANIIEELEHLFHFSFCLKNNTLSIQFWFPVNLTTTMNKEKKKWPQH